MPAFTTSCRRGFYFGCASALSIACATQVDEPPNQGSPLLDAGGSGGATAGSGAESPMETAGSGGSGGVATGGGGQGGVAPLAGSGGAATAGSAGTNGGVAGTGGASGTGGGGGASGGTGGKPSGGASGSGGAGGKASGGNAGAGGSVATQTCAKNPIPSKSSWVVTASNSNNPDPPANACDNMPSTRWSSGKDQAGNEWLQLDFGVTVTLTKLTLQLGSSPNDYPRKYAARFSSKALDNAAPVLASGMGAASTDTVMTFPTGSTGRYVLIDQLGSVTGLWWSVAEIQAGCAD